MEIQQSEYKIQTNVTLGEARAGPQWFRAGGLPCFVSHPTPQGLLILQSPAGLSVLAGSLKKSKAFLFKVMFSV